MSKDDRELIERMRGLLAKVTALPWRFNGSYGGSIEGGDAGSNAFGESLWPIADMVAGDKDRVDNALLIITAVNALPALLTRLEALQAQPVGARDREYWARVLHDAWPHTVISQALSEVTGLPIGTVLSWDAVKETGADCSGLYRFADAVVAALTASPPVVEREAIARDISRVASCQVGSERTRKIVDYILALAPVERVGEDVPAGVMDALSKVMPIRVQDGPDYADVFFSDGIAHSTQAMTMNPQDWRDLDAAYMATLTKGARDAG